MAKSSEILEASSMELAELMKTNPQGIEKDVVAHGENLVGLFHDSNFSKRRFPKLNDLKVDVLKRAIEDIAGGVLVLRSSTLGLTCSGNNLVPYVASHGTAPKGDVVFSVSWKNLAAFKAWRKDSEKNADEEVDQNDINSAIYFLTAEIAKLL